MTEQEKAERGYRVFRYVYLFRWCLSTALIMGAIYLFVVLDQQGFTITVNRWGVVLATVLLCMWAKMI